MYTCTNPSLSNPYSSTHHRTYTPNRLFPPTHHLTTQVQRRQVLPAEHGLQPQRPGLRLQAPGQDAAVQLLPRQRQVRCVGWGVDACCGTCVRVYRHTRISKQYQHHSCNSKIQIRHIFRTRSTFYMVDIPGVGYAKVPLAEKSKWVTFFEVGEDTCL